MHAALRLSLVSRRGEGNIAIRHALGTDLDELRFRFLHLQQLAEFRGLHCLCE